MVEHKKPKIQETEMEKLDAQFQEFDKNVKELTQDRMNEAPKLEMEPQTKLSSQEIEDSKKIYLKPAKAISCKQKFNEKFRESYNFDKEYVQFIAENKEIIGEAIEIWTRPYGGMPAEFWVVPTNKPVWGPRYLAEQIKKCYYHRLSMNDSKIVASDGMGTYTGQIVVDNTIQRLEASPVSTRKSIFMGANSFS